MLRERCPPPRDIFPADPWVLEAARLHPKLADELVGQAETMFALSNGYLGIRGISDEGIPLNEPGACHDFPQFVQPQHHSPLPDGRGVRLVVEAA